MKVILLQDVENLANDMKQKMWLMAMPRIFDTKKNGRKPPQKTLKSGQKPS